MELKVAEYIQTFLDVEIIPDYSGRGMFGSTTVGLAMDGEIKDILIPLALLALKAEPGSQEAAEIGEALDDLGNVQEDGLGLRKVYY